VWCAEVRKHMPGRKFSERTGHAYRVIWGNYGCHHDDNRPSWGEAWNEAIARAPKTEQWGPVQGVNRAATVDESMVTYRERMSRPEAAAQINRDLVEETRDDRDKKERETAEGDGGDWGRGDPRRRAHCAWFHRCALPTSARACARTRPRGRKTRYDQSTGPSV
jgi:hypothetical protein